MPVIIATISKSFGARWQAGETQGQRWVLLARLRLLTSSERERNGSTGGTVQRGGLAT
jgi:hypothetical protein